MAAKKKPRRASSAPAGATGTGRVLVLLEQIQGQNRATIETVDARYRSLSERMDRTDAENKVRFDALDAALRINSDRLGKVEDGLTKVEDRLTKVEDRVTKVEDTLNEVRGDLKGLARRVDRIEELLAMRSEGASSAELEARVRRIEERLGLAAP